MKTFTWLHCPGGCGRSLSCPTDAIMQRIEDVGEGFLPEFYIPYDKCIHDGAPCEWFARKLADFSAAQKQEKKP